jgi:phosphopantothenoylcysteine decarboxylase/phosphopantothenate--cysteine ligase
MQSTTPSPNLLLIISGSIAAFRALEVIRRLREKGVTVRTILTEGGSRFVTPLSVAALSEAPVYGDLFSLKDEVEMGHIRLAREADAILICPASADVLAKMAAGLADDLATACLLAAEVPVLAAPAMNTKMWQHPATRRNLAQLERDGVQMIAPSSGLLACGETGEGRLAEVETIVAAVEATLKKQEAASALPSLQGYRALVTSGPTHEPLDPVRFLGNRSSGKQGHAIAEALRDAGAEVTLVSGPVSLPAPRGIRTLSVTTAAEMLAACEASLPADIAICAAAVSDWQAKTPAPQKRKKQSGEQHLTLELVQTPDILATLSQHPQRPRLVIGFAAETEALLHHAAEKRIRKGCDWILANSVSGGAIFGEEETEITLVDASGSHPLPRMSKTAFAHDLVRRIHEMLNPSPSRVTLVK